MTAVFSPEGRRPIQANTDKAARGQDLMLLGHV
jgi:hypothetical protein